MGVGVAGQGAVGGAARLEAARAARGAGAPVSPDLPCSATAASATGDDMLDSYLRKITIII